MLHVTVIEGSATVRSQLVTQSNTLVGRSSDCHVLLRDRHISSKHGELILEGRRVIFRDLGSTNGSWLRRNRWLIAIDARRDFTVKLQDGDELLLGNAASPVRIRFCHLDSSLAGVPAESELRACVGESDPPSIGGKLDSVSCDQRAQLVIHEFKAGLRTDSSVAAICENLASSCLALFRGAAEVVVQLCVGPSNELRTVIRRGISKTQLDRELPEGAALDAFRSGVGAIVSDGSVLLAPVMNGGEPIALLQVHSGAAGADPHFRERDIEILAALTQQAKVPLSTARMRCAFERSLGLLVQAAESRHPARAGRTASVTELSRRLGDRLGLSLAERTRLERAALVHDVGMLAVPAEILTKPGRLDEQEAEIVRSHVQTGANVLQPIRLLEDLIPVVLHHHERWDGKGYPHGLGGEAIPRESRILAVADAFQAMVSERAYQSAVSATDALEELRRCSGSQFEPGIVEALGEVVGANECWTDGADTAATSSDEPEPLLVLPAASR